MKRLSEFDHFKAWLLFFLGTTIGGGLVGAIIGGVIGGFLGAAGMSVPQMTPILRITGFVIAVPISYITFRIVVGKYLFPKIEDEDDVPPKT